MAIIVSPLLIGHEVMYLFTFEQVSVAWPPTSFTYCLLISVFTLKGNSPCIIDNVNNISPLQVSRINEQI